MSFEGKQGIGTAQGPGIGAAPVPSSGEWRVPRSSANRPSNGDAAERTRRGACAARPFCSPVTSPYSRLLVI